MTEVLFYFDTQNSRECQSLYRGSRNQEYYLGDYCIEHCSNMEIKAEKLSIGTTSLIHNTSNTRQSFRRTRTHIREDSINVTVFWLLVRGRISISHQSGSSVVEEGELLVTKSLTSFFMDCQTDSDSNYEVYQLIVPSHVLEEEFDASIYTGFIVAASQAEVKLIHNIFDYLTQKSSDGDNPEYKILLDSILGLIFRSVTENLLPSVVKQTVREARIAEVIKYIQIHLSQPGLNIDKVAEGCGISPRYIFHLLKSEGLSFSSLVWGQRLKIAAKLIVSFDRSKMLISEIAYRVGFKSAAHFSRSFKKYYGLNPSEYRRKYLQEINRPLLLEDYRDQ